MGRQGIMSWKEEKWKDKLPLKSQRSGLRLGLGEKHMSLEKLPWGMQPARRPSWNGKTWICFGTNEHSHEIFPTLGSPRLKCCCPALFTTPSTCTAATSGRTACALCDSGGYAPTVHAVRVFYPGVLADGGKASFSHKISMLQLSNQWKQSVLKRGSLSQIGRKVLYGLAVALSVEG